MSRCAGTCNLIRGFDHPFLLLPLPLLLLPFSPATPFVLLSTTTLPNPVEELAEAAASGGPLGLRILSVPPDFVADDPLVALRFGFPPPPFIPSTRFSLSISLLNRSVLLVAPFKLLLLLSPPVPFTFTVDAEGEAVLDGVGDDGEGKGVP